MENNSDWQSDTAGWGTAATGCGDTSNELGSDVASAWPTGCGWSNQGPINRWGDPGQPEATAEEGQFFESMDKDETRSETERNVSFTSRVSAVEYRKHANEYTMNAVRDLMRSPEYQRVFTKCKLCWCSWSDNQYSEGCPECGGFGMTRACPLCKGQCGSVWRREVQLSHSENLAHWDGECKLPPEQRSAFLQQLLLEDATDDDVIEGMEQLTTDP